MEEVEESQAGASIFPAVNRICIALLLAAFAALLSGFRYGSFGAPETRAFIEAHLAMTALLLAVPDARYLSRLGGGVYVAAFAVLFFAAFASAALGFSNIVLAGKALMQIDARRLWIIALAAPGALGVWNVFWHIASLQEVNAAAARAAPSPEDDEEAVAAEVAAAESIPAPWATLRDYWRTALLYALLYTGAIALIILAFFYHRVAEAALFKDWFVGWSAMANGLRNAMVAGAPALIPVPLVLLLIIGGQGVFKAIGQALDLASHPDADRALTPEETGLIRDAWLELEGFLKDLPKRSDISFVYWSLIFLLFAGLAAGYALSFKGGGFGALPFQQERTAGLDWYIYRDTLGFAEVLAIFDFIFFIWSSFMIVGLIWPDLAMHSDIESKKQSAPHRDLRIVLRRAVARGVRLHAIGDIETFDPKSFLMKSWRGMTNWVVGATLLLITATAGIWYLDRMDYTLISEDYIMYTDYWTSAEHRAGYESIIAIETSCDRDEDNNLNAGYSFIFDEGRRIEVASYSTPREFQNFGREYENWSKADAKAREAGIAVDSSRVGDRCGADLEETLGAVLAIKMMALLSE